MRRGLAERENEGGVVSRLDTKPRRVSQFAFPPRLSPRDGIEERSKGCGRRRVQDANPALDEIVGREGRTVFIFEAGAKHEGEGLSIV